MKKFFVFTLLLSLAGNLYAQNEVDFWDKGYLYCIGDFEHSGGARWDGYDMVFRKLDNGEVWLTIFEVENKIATVEIGRYGEVFKLNKNENNVYSNDEKKIVFSFYNWKWLFTGNYLKTQILDYKNYGDNPAHSFCYPYSEKKIISKLKAKEFWWSDARYANLRKLIEM